ncbi:hypothetical protein [Luteimonas terrae]|uniref:Uncharacterized protein n=1 Tax=Luteimonas terrae TaxID=1530191 RepID=A0ABU1XZM5_9GAMM|nr:hypothetical protein [Luteimonas terrae]MDR7194235.1 hypothetical protein [Luteimonas terrae]
MLLPRPTLPRAVLSACLLLALGACGEASAPPPATAVPASSPESAAIRTDDASHAGAAPVTGLNGGAVRRFLVGQYGELAQLQGDWPGTPLADGLGADAASREVCARAAIGTPDAPAELVAVCGVPDGAGHANSALTDFFLLRENADAVMAAARAHMDGFGSAGDVADIAVHRFGPRLYGFVVEDGFTGQGIAIGNTSLVLPHGDGFEVAGSLRSSLDNLGAMTGCGERNDCTPDAAYDLTFDFAIDDRDTTAVAWPLRVHERGEACGRRIDRTHLVPFDPTTGAWAVPAELQRDGCD